MRDYRGYGPTPPDPRWPGGARLALVVVLNVEEGAEPSVGDGDGYSETAVSDALPGGVPEGARDHVAETLFEYGSRVGFWRLHAEAQARGLPLTINACAQALERNPELAAAVAAHDLCCHGERFVSPATMAPEAEAASMARAVKALTRTVGRPPLGWQSRYSPSDATRALLLDHGGFLYDADSYADDLPYWVRVGERPHLVVPHSFIHNDNRLTNGRLGTGEDFLAHLLAALRVLHGEGGRMMTVSLHARVSGQPSRFDAVRRFLDAVAGLEGVWCAGRSAVARHWIATHPAEESGA